MYYSKYSYLTSEELERMVDCRPDDAELCRAYAESLIEAFNDWREAMKDREIQLEAEIHNLTERIAELEDGDALV